MVLAVAPCFDEVTAHSINWIKNLLTELKCEYEALFEKDATREKFEQKVGEHELIIFYNHGDKEGLVSQDGFTYVIDKKNNHLLKDKTIYTMACLWCSDGGIDTWKKGAKVVWGYIKEFAFVTTEEELFMECANYGLIIKTKENLTWEEALEKTKEKFNEAIDKAKDPFTKIWLRWNRDALVCYTENNPPKTSTCLLRRLLIRLLGAKKAWKIKTTWLIGLILTCIGYGIAIHDFAHQVWELKGTPISLEGGYIGFIMLLAGITIMLFNEKT